ncbi:MAG TPA: heme o synthase [Polyangia bacterium]|jgi:protoheme IX farnesyltransferase|nr:heme o synthase [Polyangia bacterium]
MLVHRFAIVVAVAIYLLILIGGLVHGTGSSLACPDWPTCYGTMMPKMEGGVLIEHSHRLAAGTVVILTLALAVMLTTSAAPEHRRLRPFGWMAVVLVFVQALLGGITVLLRLPTPISTAHTATSLLFFMTVVYIAARSRPASAGDAPASLSGPAVTLAIVSAVSVYFQMVLGGLVRHSGAALACTDVPLCRGAIWPDAHPTVLIQALHRLNAVVAGALVVASSIVTWRSARARWDLRALAVVAPALVAVQIALGVRAVQTFLDLATVEAHLGVATALLAVQVLIVLRGRPSVAPAPWRLTWAREIVRLAKPRITGLVIVTFLGGLWLAPGAIEHWRVLMTLIGTVLLVAGANTFNQIMERDVDPLMERTRDRPLPRETVSPEAALVFATALSCASLPLLFLGGNLLTGLLGFLALGSYVGVYTPMKRRSGAALFVGAIPGAIPPLMGWTAVTGRLDLPGLVLFAILFLWQIPHFLAIAIYRARDYAAAGFRVLPAAISERATRFTIVGFSIILVASTILLEPLRVAGMRYVGAATLLGAVLIGWAAAGFRRKSSGAWARSLFLFSIVYLTLLFVALAIDRTVA